MREGDFSLKVADCRFELGESSSSSTHPPEKKEGSCVPTPGHERENSDPGQNTNPKN